MRWLLVVLLTSLYSCSGEPSDAGPDAAGADSSADTSFDSSPSETLGEDALGEDALGADTETPLTDSTSTDSACPALKAAVDVDPWSMRPKSAGFGGIVEETVGTHKDVFLSSPTKLLRIATRLDWGGTVVFFGLSANAKSNVIDANDTGRELQLALYDPTRIRQGCAATASCTTAIGSCAASIAYLGWDPVQGGDECNRGAPVLSHGAVGDALEVVIQPLQWNPDWDAPDCRTSPCTGAGRPVDVIYRMRLRFVREHVVEVDTEVNSKETISHPSTAQEFPTLYVANGAGGNPDLPLLLDAAGSAVTIATPANDGFYVANFASPAPWVTWQNATRDYGVGLAMDQGITAFQGWRGDGTKAPYFHNVRAQIEFGLAAGATVRGMSYLALGGLSTVKAELESAARARGPFGHIDAATFAKGAPLKVSGWALDNRPGTVIEVHVDGAKMATAMINKERPDVCATYPGYSGCPGAGFEVSIPTTDWTSCARLVRVTASDADGNLQILGERIVEAK